MLRHKPLVDYCGLTIILSNPSRFDLGKNQLLTAGGGRLLEEFLQPTYNRYQCDIRVKEEQEPLLPETKCILVLGEPALHLLYGNTDNSLNELRGSPFHYNNIPCIASYFPQDAADPKDFENEFNVLHNSGEGSMEDGRDDEESDEKGRKNATKRKNFRFWLKQDILRVKHIMAKGIPPRPFEPNYIIAPPSNEIIHILSNRKGQELFIDIETFMPFPYIKCIAFSFGRERDIFCVPLFGYDYRPSYSCLPNIFKAIAVALHNNCTIAHNGAHFDFLVFAWLYKIAIGRQVKDTMLMMHRMYGAVEKSLGHGMSLYTWEKFHKDEGNSGYYNAQQVKDTLAYCGKDVFGMKLIYYELLERAKKIPGMLESMERANSMIRPYLTMSMQGFAYDEQMRVDTIKENDALCNHYIKWSKMLIGEGSLKAIAGKSKSSLLNSNKQCVEYFHNLLGYDVVARGKEKEDGSRGPSLAKNAMYKLRIKYDNPVIDLCLAYRELVRQTGYLNFTPWEPDILKQPRQYKQETMF